MDNLLPLDDVRARLAGEHADLVAPLVHRITARFPRHIDREDLVADGTVGLMDAARRYDATDDVPFAQYAKIRIRGAVMDGARARDWAPRSLRRRLRELEEAAARLRARGRREPSEAQLAAELDLSPAALDALRADQLTACLLAVELPATTDSEVPILEELTEGDSAVIPATATELREEMDTLRRALGVLPDPLHWIVTEHDLGGRQLAELAAELGVSDARLSQLHREAIDALRAAFAVVYDEVEPVEPDAPGQGRRRQVVAAMRESLVDTTRAEGGDGCHASHGHA